MSTADHWKSSFDSEIRRAAEARLAGNEGMTRVCARRAAGALVGEYLRRQDFNLPTPSAHDRLRFLSDLPHISPRAKQAADNLLARVTTDFQLPVEADLIAEAHALRRELLAE
jgi:hypothetical protein